MDTPHWHVTERRLVLYSHMVCLWGSLLSALLLTLCGYTVPHEFYYLATGAFGVLSTLARRRQPANGRPNSGGLEPALDRDRSPDAG